jgi:hypothetical protein
MAFERDSSTNDMIALSGSILLTTAALESRLTVEQEGYHHYLISAIVMRLLEHFVLESVSHAKRYM